MNLVYSFPRSGAIPAGSAVVYDSTTKKVKVSSDGTGTVVGVYGFEGNPSIASDGSEQSIGVTVAGLCKVQVGDAVAAFDFGILGSAGVMKSLGEETEDVKVCGFFLEDGVAGDYVDFYVSPSMFNVATTTTGGGE